MFLEWFSRCVYISRPRDFSSGVRVEVQFFSKKTVFLGGYGRTCVSCLNLLKWKTPEKKRCTSIVARTKCVECLARWTIPLPTILVTQVLTKQVAKKHELIRFWYEFGLHNKMGLGASSFTKRVSKKEVHTLIPLLDQGYGRGVPPIFTPGSKPKKGIPLDQGYGRGVPPIFTPGSKAKKGRPKRPTR